MLKGSSNKRWPGAGLALFLTASMFIIGQIAGMFIAWILVYLWGDATVDPPVLFGSSVLLQFAYGLAVYGLTLLMVARLLRWYDLRRDDVGLTRLPRLSDIGSAVLAFAVYISAYLTLVAFVAPFIPGLDINQRQDTGFEGAHGLVPLCLVFFALVILAPFVEEVLMRGFLFTALRRRLLFRWAVIITSLAFAALHLGGGEEGAGPLWIAAVDTFVLSVVLCYLREKTGRLWASIGVHMIKNGVAFLMLFVFRVV